MRKIRYLKAYPLAHHLNENLKTIYEANDAIENYDLNQVKARYYPETSYIAFNMQLTCILSCHKMYV
jgi:hypothetical protein